MAENPHYGELLQLLNEFEVEYLIVGGFAVMKYGEPRYTKDLDVWVHNSPHNSARIVGALRKFGAPLEHDGITTETFTGKQVVYQIGIAPVRIDILTEITGVEFPGAWGKRVASTFFGVPVHFISLDDLMTNKQALGRSSDLEDLKQNPKRMTSFPTSTQINVRRNTVTLAGFPSIGQLLLNWTPLSHRGGRACLASRSARDAGNEFVSGTVAM
jgi:predicted nucleotidyltransferase